MAKKRKFKNTYVVTIEGVTNNGYQAQLFNDVLRGIGKAFGVYSQQSRVTIKVLETSGDFDADLQETKPQEHTSDVPQ